MCCVRNIRKELRLDLVQALALGILQGATEFLPISSSGHLVLVPWLLNWEEPLLLFDVVVHLGTLLAVLFFFRRDWLTLAHAGMTALRHHTTEDPDTRLLLWLVLGTIPAALAGLLFESVFQAAFSDPPLVAALLLVTALLLFASERRYTAERTLNDLNARDVLVIGLAQAFAIFPGMSRSGGTIAAGIFQGQLRPVAARFSFLLASPIIFGTWLKEMLDLWTNPTAAGQDVLLPLIAGFLAAALVGYVCIWFLMRLLQQRRLHGFAMYGAASGMPCLLVALFS
jgi:undecaprenyl-diphosphatase